MKTFLLYSFNSTSIGSIILIFFKEVERIWLKPCRAKSALDKIQQKLKLIKQFFKGWGFNLQGELRKQRKANQSELADLEKIEEEIGLSVSQLEWKTWLMCENFESLEQEELYWFERSHEIGYSKEI